MPVGIGGLKPLLVKKDRPLFDISSLLDYVINNFLARVRVAERK
jgi:hypothetical protein